MRESLERKRIYSFLEKHGSYVSKLFEGVVPFFGPLLGKICEDFTEKDVDIIMRKIEDFEKNISDNQSEIERIVNEILSKSIMYNKIVHEQQSRAILAERNEMIYEFGKLLEVGNITEKMWYEKNVKHLDESIKSYILTGNLSSHTKTLFKKYFSEGRENSEPMYRARSLLLISDYFHILDEYENSRMAYLSAMKVMENNLINIEKDIIDIHISLGHILLHLNKVNDAKKYFIDSIKDIEIHPVNKARNLFRLGEIYIVQGEYRDAINTFEKSLKICDEEIYNHYNECNQIIADNYRRIGTSYRMKKNYYKADKYYNTSKEIYDKGGYRGRIWLLHGIAELHRANNEFIESLQMYEKAKLESEKAFNINRSTHAKLGILEVKRIQNNVKKTDYLEIYNTYSQIQSSWGIANIFITQALILKNYKKEKNKLLDKAIKICKGMGLKYELNLINEIKLGKTDQLHPLSLF